MVKAPKKRRLSNVSSEPPKSGSEGSAASSSSSSAPVAMSSQSHADAMSFSGLGLSMGVPVAPPSFPAYFQPEHSTDFRNQSSSINPAVIPLSRRFSDVSYGTTLPTRRLDASPGSSAAVAGVGGDRPSRPLVGRSRAFTLAGLPESLGCFSLVNSPEPSVAGDDDSSDDEVDASDEKAAAASGDCEVDVVSWADPFPPPESHYPSPAFSSYSPTDLPTTDPLSDLHAILANDPVPASFHHPPSPSQPTQPEFDYEAFAASIEGAPASQAAPPPLPFPTTLEELLNAANHRVLTAASAKDRYPTPPSGSLAASTLTGGEPSPGLSSYQVDSAAASFDLNAELNALASTVDMSQMVSSDEAEQQAREAAATAALFGGFGSPSMASSLGLDFGLPTASPMPSFFPPVSKYHPPPAPPRGFGLPSSASPSMSTNPCFNSFAGVTPVANPSQIAFTAFGGTYSTASFPSLNISLPGFDLPNLPVATSAPPFPVPSAAPPSTSTSSKTSATTGNLHDRLTAAWEKRPRTSPPAPVKKPLYSAPAFYIPSSTSTSAPSLKKTAPVVPPPQHSPPIINWLA